MDTRFDAMTTRCGKVLLIALGLTLAVPAFAQGTGGTQEFNGSPSRSARTQETGRIIVKWRERARSMSPFARAQKASEIAGLELQTSGRSGDIEALAAAKSSGDELAKAVAQLERDADVEAASIEYRRQPHRLTDDPLLMQQWYLLGVEPSATRTEAAWDVTQGNPGIVVAVVDTGIRSEHPDLQGKLLPGFDFISNELVANDGNGRDSDASDPGDWVTRAEVDQNPNDFLDADCLNDDGSARNSSWHGTRVAGLIAAGTNNTQGVAGNAWNTRVLPIRALGKCGGFDLDIIDGMRWAAGIQVGTLPLNPNPAKIINMSLGGDSPCTAVYQNAVNEIIARGTLIVASAGNEGRAVSAPANCIGVLGVGGLRHVGTKVGYSNLGPQVGISAPAGNCVNTGFDQDCLYSIIVATNSGTTTPLANGYTDARNFNVGTSFSAPLVASAAALLHAVNDTLTPAQTISLLKDVARPFPTNPQVAACTVPTSTSPPQGAECNCTTQTCGAGMLDTGAALLAVQGPLAVIQTNGTVAVGSSVTINGASSFSTQGRSIVAHQWSVLNITGATPTIANGGGAETTLQIPGESQFTLRLTVTDSQGTEDTKDLALAAFAPTPPPTPPAPPAPSGISNGGGGGGGGQLGWELLALALLGLRRRARFESIDQLA